MLEKFKPPEDFDWAHCWSNTWPPLVIGACGFAALFLGVPWVAGLCTGWLIGTTLRQLNS